MNRHVNAIAGRLSLRPPQRKALEILSRVTEIAPPKKDFDRAAVLALIRSEYPSVIDFERDFPSLCFSLATGVGKTRLMGAFISYLYLAHGLKNFFILAPNLTIYTKLYTDFRPNTPKYVFKGIAEFATEPPEIITGDNYESGIGVRGTQFFENVHINIFNISKINTEVRGGKSPKIKRLREYIGESYFDYLAGLPDLVLLMDESHRYRASAGERAINELKPILGLELTATPQVETNKGPVDFKNVIQDYPLACAMADGFVKEPAVVTRQFFSPAGMSTEDLDRMKLEDGVRLHESIKVELETYARETGSRIVKPFVLVIARDTTHAAQLLQMIQSASFFEGRYATRVIQVDSSKAGAEEDEMIQRLLAVESPDEPTELVIHVNMLKEGWDVTNLYTIVPLRAAKAQILIKQTIGRGLRLPYGKRTGVSAVDRLNIIAHDKFQEIVDEASRPGSPIHLQQVLLSPEQLSEKTITVVSQPRLASALGVQLPPTAGSSLMQGDEAEPAFAVAEEQQVAQLTYAALQKLAGQPEKVPGLSSLERPEIQREVAAEVAAQYHAGQLGLSGVSVDIPNVVAQTTALVIRQLIGIPRVLVMPKQQISSGFRSFTINVDTLKYPAVSEELWMQHLRTGKIEKLTLGAVGIDEARPEDYIVSGLVDFDDISYEDHSELLYSLSKQVVNHFLTYLSEDDMRKVLRCYQKPIASFIHSQMRAHHWEDPVDYEAKISKGFQELKASAYTTLAMGPVQDFRVSPEDKSNMAKYLFGGFSRCLYSVQKFQSEAERKLSLILEREAQKWFKPAKGQFQIYFKSGGDQLEYQPDFVAETEDTIFMLETKARNQITAPDVLAKRDAAVRWCEHASKHAATYGGKSWQYALMPSDVVANNMTLDMLLKQFICKAASAAVIV